MHIPLILNIKANSLDDGPGVRTVIFFKGCPLSCIWCHNPESKRVDAEISFSSSDCINCGVCRNICKHDALNLQNPFYIDREKCTLCYECVDNCCTNALSRVGKNYTIKEIFNKILSDKIFYDISGGGVTLSGGEVTLYPEFAGELLSECKKADINTLIETCGLFDFSKFNQYMLPYLDVIYFDLKLYDRDLHKKYCGSYNDVILQNFITLINYADRNNITVLPRVPLIPEITDTDDNLNSIADFLASLKISQASLLPYNPTWYPKNKKLGLDDPAVLSKQSHWQSSDKINHCKDIFTHRNIKV